MSVFKCKMCGGNIQADGSAAYGTCDSCGTASTLPKVNDKKLINLFNRANDYRQQNEFDRALGIYESLLNEDNTNAEAHWGIVLCRYGIEYVEDPRTHERIPTCHRVQYAPILTDPDYLAALDNAQDSHSRNIYEGEAKRINDIQKGILAISQREEPFDIFICYKETTDGGSRSKDSVIAQDIYYHLQNAGYRVFFSKITLEDKLGREYEPYIFAALNSAKIMLVVGTKPEHFNSVWVRNEWSRYLTLMKGDRSLLLIPCYRDMDPYDLPDEFSHLQAQDMSKIGFLQDLLHGIKKVLSTSGKPESAAEYIHETPSTTAVAGAATGTANVRALLKRAYIFLEDSEFERADDFFEQVLNNDPENAHAYVGKVLAELKLKHEGDLAKHLQPFGDNPNYRKAIRFADDNYRQTLERYISDSISYADTKNKKHIYLNAKRKKSSQKYKDALKLFESISDYKDAKEQADDCRILVNEETYQHALNNKSKELYKEAITLFKSIPDYKDSAEQIGMCGQLLQEQRLKEAEEAKIRKLQQQEEASINALRKIRKRSLFFGISGLLLSWIPILGLILSVIGLVISVKGQKRAELPEFPAHKFKPSNVVSIVAITLSFLFNTFIFASSITYDAPQSANSYAAQTPTPSTAEPSPTPRPTPRPTPSPKPTPAIVSAEEAIIGTWSRHDGKDDGWYTEYHFDKNGRYYDANSYNGVLSFVVEGTYYIEAEILYLEVIKHLQNYNGDGLVSSNDWVGLTFPENFYIENDKLIFKNYFTADTFTTTEYSRSIPSGIWKLS